MEKPRRARAAARDLIVKKGIRLEVFFNREFSGEVVEVVGLVVDVFFHGVGFVIVGRCRCGALGRFLLLAGLGVGKGLADELFDFVGQFGVVLEHAFGRLAIPGQAWCRYS